MLQGQAGTACRRIKIVTANIFQFDKISDNLSPRPCALHTLNHSLTKGIKIIQTILVLKAKDLLSPKRQKRLKYLLSNFSNFFNRFIIS